MVDFPNCKINLGLNIIRKREDGFHDIETIFYPLPLYDVLEIIQPEEDLAPLTEIEFSSSGIPVDGAPEDNLCMKAHHLLKKDFLKLTGLKLHLHKTIPAGAGLGGGSADGAFTLKLLNKKFQLNLSSDRLIEYAAQLGSDCPFFILDKPCFGRGRGELLEPILLDLSFYTILLVNPGITIHTANAFSQIIPALPLKRVNDIVRQPLSTWKDELKNDFEEAVFGQYPEIRNIRDELYQAGAIYASLSGSGSTVYGIFEKEKKPEFSFPAHYFTRQLTG